MQGIGELLGQYKRDAITYEGGEGGGPLNSESRAKEVSRIERVITPFAGRSRGL